MSAAPLWGDTAVERNRTRLRQQPSPQDFKNTSSEVVRLPIADRRPPEEEKSIPAALAGKNSQPITNVGVLAKCVKRVHELVALRYSDGRVPAADAAGIFTVLAAIDAAAVRADASFVPDLNDWSVRSLRALTADARAEIRAELDRHPFEITAEFLGEQLGITAAERRKLKFWSAEPIGASASDARAVALEADRVRKATQRRQIGIPPKGQRFTEMQAMHPGASRSAIYRMLAKESAAKPKKGGRSGGI